MALSAWGQSGVVSLKGAPTLGIFMDFEAAPGNSSLAIMQREVTNLLKPSGISVKWRLTQENKGNEKYARLVVLKFNGSCRVDGRWLTSPVKGGAVEPGNPLASARGCQGGERAGAAV